MINADKTMPDWSDLSNSGKIKSATNELTFVCPTCGSIYKVTVSTSVSYHEKNPMPAEDDFDPSSGIMPRYNYSCHNNYCGQLCFECDPEIAELVSIAIKNGIETNMCCQGHIGDSSGFYAIDPVSVYHGVGPFIDILVPVDNGMEKYIEGFSSIEEKVEGVFCFPLKEVIECGVYYPNKVVYRIFAPAKYSVLPYAEIEAIANDEEDGTIEYTKIATMEQMKADMSSARCRLAYAVGILVNSYNRYKEEYHPDVRNDLPIHYKKKLEEFLNKPIPTHYDNVDSE